MPGSIPGIRNGLQQRHANFLVGYRKTICSSPRSPVPATLYKYSAEKEGLKMSIKIGTWVYKLKTGNKIRNSHIGNRCDRRLPEVRNEAAPSNQI